MTPDVLTTATATRCIPF